MASIIQNDSGNWRVQIEHHGKREYKTFKLKSLADRWATQREAELQRGLVASVDDAQRTPFFEVIECYRDKVLPTKRNRSDRFTLNLLEERLGHIRLISLQTKDIANFRDTRLSEGKAPATVVKELNLLRVLIDYAINEMSIYLPSNQARLIKNPSVKNARDRILSAEEEAQLFGAFEHPMLGIIATLALETACRLGELLNMSWEDINFTDSTLHIPLTKTDIPRTIPLSPKAIVTLKSLPRPIEGGRIFSCWARIDSFENVFRRARARARKRYELKCAETGKKPDSKFLHDLRFHDLRHTATSRLAKLIPNVVELSRITGHTDLKMLSRYYHISAAELAKKLA